MRRFLLTVLIVVLALSLVACGADEGANGDGLTPGNGDGLDVPADGEGEMVITGEGVDTPELAAVTGETVTFVNGDSVAHSLTIVYLGIPLVEDEMLDPGEEFERAFQEEGEYEVIVDDNAEMGGTITVR